MKTDAKMISDLFFRLLPVQILLVAVGSINSLIDGAMAGTFIGPIAMAMIGLYAPAIKIIETINTVLLGGSQILCGQFLGKNQIDRTCSVFSLDMSLLLLISVLFTALGMIAPRLLAGILGADRETIGGLADYILGMSPGIIPWLLSMQLTAFLQIEQQQKRTYASMAVMAAVNVGLDYLFIHELGMGMLGLGLATSVSYWAAFAVLGSYYFTGKATIVFRRQGIDWKDFQKIVIIGFPGAIVTFCLAVRGVVLNALLLRYSGNDGICALSALNTCGGLLYAVTAGLGSATRLLVSIYIGEEDPASLTIVMRTALTKGIAMVSGVAALVFLLAGPISGIFFEDHSSAVYHLTVLLFRIYPFCMPLSAINVIMVNYFQSASRMKIVHVLSIMDGVAGTVLSSLILAPVLGAAGVWIAHVLNGVYTLAAVVVYSCMHRRKIPHSIEDLLAIPEDFGVAEDQRLDISIHNETEVTETSQLVMDFCRRVGIDAKRSIYAGLCMEEMAGNIVEHGFTDGKDHMVDVRVVNRPEGLLLRIKDDCRAFNPKEKLELIDPEDVTHNIGLRMAQRFARELSYSNVLGLNVLTILL